MSMEVRILLDGENAVRIVPMGAVDSAFIAGVQGARHDKDRGVWVARLDSAIPIAVKLRDLRFHVEIGEQASAALRGKLASKREEKTAAEQRVEDIDAKLRANGKALRPYQRDGVRFLASRDRALLCDEMRLGKTVQVLAAIPARPRLMIVCPKSVRSVWETEALFWRNDIFPIMHNGREPLRWPNPGEMIVCSYEQMDEEMPPAPPEVTFVGDEAHVFKKKNSLRSKRFRAMSRRVIDRGGKVIGLTATPLMDHATDLYNVLEAFELETEVFGNFARFYRLFNARRNERGFTQWGEADPKVHELMKRVMLRRRRAEVFPDLPPKSFVTIDCKLPEKLKRASNQVVMAMGGFDWLKSDILDGGVDTTGTGHTALRKEIASAKIDAMLDVVNEYAEAREPLVVFSAHTEPIRALAKRKDYAILLGETSDSERRRAIEDFQAGKLAGIGLSIRAGGVGIKLTRANNVLFVDREWTPALNWQAQDRVVDVDDKEKRITVMSIVGDHPLDARVEEIVRIKETLFNAAIDGRTE
jgi:SWI/SNF-related matrix-associated actin-dependent regulator of chromatin subfamily A-like protein 1